jgi:hypothetical protein
MINVFRLHQRKLMLVIAILTIIAFVWLYNPANLNEMGANDAYTLYGRQLSQADVQREANKYYLAIDLQQLDLIGDLAGMAQDENQMLNEFIWNLFVLQHESRQLGIEPSDAQIAERIKSLPVFQTGGQFDPAKYGKFVSEKLGPRGFTERQLEGVIKDSLRLEVLKDVIGSPVAVSQAEVADAARILQKVDLQTVNFSAEEVLAAVTVTDDDIKMFYNQYQNSPMLIAPETRAVELVEFALPADAKPADGKAPGMEALQKLADAAIAFSSKAGSGDFAQLAGASGLTVIKTPEFDRTGAAKGDLPENLSSLSEIAPAAFLLSDQAPVSDPIQAGDKFYVAKLVSTIPQRAMTLEEVRPMAEMRIRASKAGEALRQKADAAVTKIRAAMAGGKSFADAVAAEGLKVESLTGVSPTGAAPDQQAIMRASLLMQPGQVSGFIPGMTGGYVAYLAARAPLDAAELARQKDEIEPGLIEGKRRMLFVTWLDSARDAAKIGRVTRER